MAVMDISGIEYFMPIIGFLFVLILVFALLKKTKLLGGTGFIDFVVAAIIAVIFSTVSSVRSYVETVTPWFVVLVIAVFFILVILGMTQKDITVFMKPWFGWVFLVILILVFFFSATTVFSSALGNVWGDITEFMTVQSRVAGSLVLLIVAIIFGAILINIK